MNDLIAVRDLCKTIGNVEALKDLNFEVGDGEFLAVQGPSGSGKTTLLGLMAGLERPTSGRIVFNGNEITSMTEEELALFRRHNVGIVFQFFNLIPTLNVIENIALPLFPENPGKMEMFERAGRAAESVGLAHRLDHHPNELSGGEQQRVAIARALINRPRAIFADEPTGNLDTKTGGKIMALLKGLNEGQGLTVVMVTHDDALAREADRIIKLKDGVILDE
jgi:putative ABC transport system ATP-binding protein